MSPGATASMRGTQGRTPRDITPGAGVASELRYRTEYEDGARKFRLGNH